jgi:hypothetical protein
MMLLKFIYTILFSILFYLKVKFNFLSLNSALNIFIYYNIYIFLAILIYTFLSLTIPILTKDNISLTQSLKKSIKYTKLLPIYIKISFLFYLFTLLFWLFFLIVIVCYNFFTKNGIYKVGDLLISVVKFTEQTFEQFYFLSSLLCIFLALLINIVSVIIYKELNICYKQNDNFL